MNATPESRFDTNPGIRRRFTRRPWSSTKSKSRRPRRLRFEALERRALLAATYEEIDHMFVGPAGHSGYISESFAPPTEEGSSKTIVVGASGFLHNFLDSGGTLALTEDQWQRSIDLEPGSGPATFSISAKALDDLIGVPENEYWLLGARITIAETLRIPGEEIQGKTRVYSLYRFVSALAGDQAASAGSETIVFNPTIIGQSSFQYLNLATSSRSSAWVTPESPSFIRRGSTHGHEIEFHPTSTASAQQLDDHEYLETSRLEVSRSGNVVGHLQLSGTMLDAGPDLVGAGFTIEEDEITWGDEVTVNFNVTNQGVAEAGESVTQFVISPDANFGDEGDIFGPAITVPALAPDQPLVGSRTWKLPDIPPDAFSSADKLYIGMIADATDQVDEFLEGEANNQGVRRTVDWSDVELELINRTLSIKPVSGLAKYADAASNAVYRRAQDRVQFQTDASDKSAPLLLEILRDGQVIHNRTLSPGAATGYWDIPANAAVGKYSARIQYAVSQNVPTGSEAETEFFVIFAAPNRGLSGEELAAYLYDEKLSPERRDEKGVWFAPNEPMRCIGGWPFCTPPTVGGDRAIGYELHPFEQKVFRTALDNVGRTPESARKVTTSLTDWVLSKFHPNSNKEAGKNARGIYDVHHLLNSLPNSGKIQAQCADMVNMLVALLRSSGIAARPVAVDASVYGGNWYFHTWAEVFLEGKWQVIDPFVGITNAIERSKLEGRGINAHARDKNDIILVAKPNFDVSALGDKNWDIQWKYERNGGVPDPIPKASIAGWIDDLRHEYWLPTSAAPGGQTQSLTQTETTAGPSSPWFDVGFDLRSAEITVGQPGEIAFALENNTFQAMDVPIRIGVFHQQGSNVKEPILEELLTLSLSSDLPPQGTVNVKETLSLPEDLEASDQYLLLVEVGDVGHSVSLDVRPAVTTEIIAAAPIREGEEHEVSAKLTNTTDRTIHNVRVSMRHDPGTWLLGTDAELIVGDLPPGATKTVSWSMVAVGAARHGIDFRLTSDDGGADVVHAWVDVLATAQLDIQPLDALVVSPTGTSFEANLSLQLRNLGDQPAEQIQVELQVPNGVSVGKTNWNYDSLAGRSSAALSTTAMSSGLNGFPIKVIASEGGQIRDSVWLWVDVVQNSPWQNAADRIDVNGDQEATASDALRIINHLPNFENGYLPARRSDFYDAAYYDVNGDGLISALDALQVINHLGTQIHGNAPESDRAGLGSQRLAVGVDPSRDDSRNETSIPLKDQTNLTQLAVDTAFARDAEFWIPHDMADDRDRYPMSAENSKGEIGQPDDSRLDPLIDSIGLLS